MTRTSVGSLAIAAWPTLHAANATPSATMTGPHRPACLDVVRIAEPSLVTQLFLSSSG
jgi:hypothetical protein